MYVHIYLHSSTDVHTDVCTYCNIPTYLGPVLDRYYVANYDVFYSYLFVALLFLIHIAWDIAATGHKVVSWLGFSLVLLGI